MVFLPKECVRSTRVRAMVTVSTLAVGTSCMLRHTRTTISHDGIRYPNMRIVQRGKMYPSNDPLNHSIVLFSCLRQSLKMLDQKLGRGVPGKGKRSLQTDIFPP